MSENTYNYKESRIKASIKYDKNNSKTITIKLNKNTDKDILEHLEKVENNQGYIKRLIREDIERSLK